MRTTTQSWKKSRQRRYWRAMFLPLSLALFSTGAAMSYGRSGARDDSKLMPTAMERAAAELGISLKSMCFEAPAGTNCTYFDPPLTAHQLAQAVATMSDCEKMRAQARVNNGQEITLRGLLEGRKECARVAALRASIREQSDNLAAQRAVLANE